MMNTRTTTKTAMSTLSMDASGNILREGLNVLDPAERQELELLRLRRFTERAAAAVVCLEDHRPQQVFRPFRLSATAHHEAQLRAERRHPGARLGDAAVLHQRP